MISNAIINSIKLPDQLETAKPFFFLIKDIGGLLKKDKLTEESLERIIDKYPTISQIENAKEHLKNLFIRPEEEMMELIDGIDAMISSSNILNEDQNSKEDTGTTSGKFKLY